jgi:hypothetical protein
MQTISVLGYYDKGNIGDEAYKLAFQKLFPQYKFEFKDHITGKPEVIILGGGDVLSKGFIEIIDKHPQARKYALSVNFRQEHIPLIPKFNKIVSRNYTGSGIETMPDFTFALSGNNENGKKLIKDLCERNDVQLYNKKAVLTLNSYLCRREHILGRDYITFDKVCYELANLIDETAATFILLPLGNGFPENDRIANSFVYANTKFYKKNLLVYDKLSVQETLDIFAAVDVAITSRLHAAIFSCIGNTPFIDVTHHTKNRMFLESIGRLEWSINYWHFDYYKAKTLLWGFLESDRVKFELAEVTNSLQKLLLPLASWEL